LYEVDGSRFEKEITIMREPEHDYPGGRDDSWRPVDLGPVLERLADPDHVVPECAPERRCCLPGRCMVATARGSSGE